MIEHKVLRAGQARAYQDSVYDYEVTSDESFEAVKQHCITKIYKVDPTKELPAAKHDGACGWPFGLNPYYSFREINKGVYRYTVTSPFCD
jgi:hypothetical protein